MNAHPEDGLADLLVERIAVGASRQALDRLASALEPLLMARNDALASAQAEDCWMDLARAATYVGLTPEAMYKHTSARTVPFEQDAPGCKCWFKRSKLDAWRRGEWKPGDANS